MAYKDKNKEAQYQKEYYEKHKKLKGRRKSSGTFIKNEAIRKKFTNISEKWSRLSKEDKKKNRAKYLNKLKALRRSLNGSDKSETISDNSFNAESGFAKTKLSQIDSKEMLNRIDALINRD